MTKQTDDLPILQWKQLEKQLVVDLYPIIGSIHLAALTGRSKEVIRRMAGRLGVTRWRRFTQIEREAITAMYPGMPSPDLARRFNRPLKAIEALATKLQLRKDGFVTRVPWTKEEAEALAAIYVTSSKRVLSARFNRSEKAILAKALNMGLERNPVSDLNYPPELVEVIRLQRTLDRALNDRQHDSNAA